MFLAVLINNNVNMMYERCWVSFGHNNFNEIQFRFDLKYKIYNILYININGATSLQYTKKAEH